MNSAINQNRIGQVKPQVWRLTLGNQGNLLVYMVVVILIFGVLGVSLVSLFTTSTGSSATSNDAKRALFIAESGIRYAFSEIRNSPDIETAAELLNTTAEFKLGKNGSFTINVFSPGLKSAQNKTIFGSGSLILDVPYGGKFPEDFLIPNVSVIDWLRFKENPIPDDSIAAISSSTKADPPEAVTVDLTDDFDIDLKDTVSFAVLVTDAGTDIPRGSSIYVDEDAKDFFPVKNGAIRIMNRTDQVYYDYFYESRVNEPSNNRVALTNVREMPNGTWQNIANLTTTDHVILSPYNFRVFAKGRSDEITTEIGYKEPLWALANPSEYTIYMRELLQDAQINQAGDVIRTQEAGDKKIELGRGSSGPEGFGDLWYGGEKPIGGDPIFCVEGRCFFDEGIRVYYTVDLTGDGEGFTFALISAGEDPAVNSAFSAGGDFELSELLAYAGDSRLDPAGTTFVDKIDLKNPAPRGLQPPKIAIEFDTRTNLNVPLQYCQSEFNLAPNSRNDPMPDNAAKDVVQHVFWGNESLTIPCRGNNSLYDDNRHDAEGDELSFNWLYDTESMVISSPAIDKTGGPYDGTIYVGSNNNDLYALKPDGTLKWTFSSTADIQSSPAIGIDGTIYVGSNNGSVYAIDPSDGSSKWSVDTGGAVISSPSIDLSEGGSHSGTIYVGSGEPSIPGNGKVLAINPNGSIKWQFVPTDPHSVGDLNVDSSPAVDENGNIYVGADTRVLYALNPDDREAGLPFPTANEWYFPTLSPLAGGVESKPAISNLKATVYIESESFFLYAVNISNGVQRWALDIDPTGSVSDDGELESSPVLGPDGTIYVGSKDGRLYAVNHDDRLAASPFPTAREWTFDTGGEVRSTPAIGGDGTIYVGSGSGRLFAINPNGTEKWRFPPPTTPAIGSIISSPEVDSGSAIYFGSNNNNFYAISDLALPRNFRNTYPGFQRGFLTSENLDSEVVVDDVNNWLNGSSTQRGPWAIRMEVERDSSTNQYVLLTWVRQCAQLDCSDINGTLFQDTTRKYDYSPIPELPFTQTVTLAGSDDDKFERFLFGFTTAAKDVDNQLNVIRDFQLTFIRKAIDPTINNDPDWTPP